MVTVIFAISAFLSFPTTPTSYIIYENALKRPVEARRKIDAARQVQARLTTSAVHRHAAERHVLHAHVEVSLFHGVIHQRCADVSAIDHARTCYLPRVPSAGASRLQDFVESQFSVHIPHG